MILSTYTDPHTLPDLLGWLRSRGLTVQREALRRHSPEPVWLLRVLPPEDEIEGRNDHDRGLNNTDT